MLHCRGGAGLMMRYPGMEDSRVYLFAQHILAECLLRGGVL